MSLIVESQGAVCSLGKGWPAIWDALVTGKTVDISGPSYLRNFEFPMALAEFSGLDRTIKEDSVDAAAARLVNCAVDEALYGTEIDEKIRLYGGTTHGEYDILYESIIRRNNNLGCDIPDMWSKALIFDSIPRLILEHVDADISLESWVYSACTSSMHAMVMAFFDDLSGGFDDDLFLVTGVDALSILEVSGFITARAVAESSCMPFHKQRGGILIGEGAAALRLRNMSVTGHQGQIELIGVGMSCDAGHPMDPDPGGHGVATAIERSLTTAGLDPSDVAGVVLHGTGTEKNDIAETQALRNVFGRYSPPCMSVKSTIGHTMGAAGVFNCLIAVEACRQHVLPPSGRMRGPILNGIDLVLDKARNITEGPVLACSSGFGGNNCTVIFRKAT